MYRPELIRSLQRQSIWILRNTDQAEPGAVIVVISFAPVSLGASCAVTAAHLVRGGRAHFREASLAAIVDGSLMQVARNEDDVVNVIRVDEVLQRLPFRLIASPGVGELGRGVCDHRGKNDFPDRGGGDQAIL